MKTGVLLRLGSRQQELTMRGCRSGKIPAKVLQGFCVPVTHAAFFTGRPLQLPLLGREFRATLFPLALGANLRLDCKPVSVATPLAYAVLQVPLLL